MLLKTAVTTVGKVNNTATHVHIHRNLSDIQDIPLFNLFDMLAKFFEWNVVPCLKMKSKKYGARKMIKPDSLTDVQIVCLAYREATSIFSDHIFYTVTTTAVA